MEAVETVDETLKEVAEGIAEKIGESVEEVLEEMEKTGGIPLWMLIAMSEPLD